MPETFATESKRLATSGVTSLLHCRGRESPASESPEIPSMDREHPDQRGATAAVFIPLSEARVTSNRSRFITLVQAATKSVTNFCSPSSLA